MIKNSFLSFCLLLYGYISAQCPSEKTGVTWLSSEAIVMNEEVALSMAPILWFSSDEESLRDAGGNIRLPENFPFEKGDGPTVYFKINTIYLKYGIDEDAYQANYSALGLLDLSKINFMDIEFFFYFSTETGLGQHPHDVESMLLQVEVVANNDCEKSYGVAVNNVIARAHGLYWYENIFTVDEITHFPLAVFVEEGKHAICTDRNGDGVYTPSYDVTERVNDAWGVRDIIASGSLFSGGYEAWMTKRREKESAVFPPLNANSPFYNKFIAKYGEYAKDQAYELRGYPIYKRGMLKDKGLNKLMRSKRPYEWPRLKHSSKTSSLSQWAKRDKFFKSASLVYRWDNFNDISFGLPLLVIKNVQAPLTGGWLYNKIYLGDSDSVTPGRPETSFGHQIVHGNSASRWLDTYVGMGYEFIDEDYTINGFDHRAFLVSEVGIKIRFNVSNSPLKFLKYLGGEFYGVRLGWKNIGLDPFRYSGFVIEFGAGVF